MKIKAQDLSGEALNYAATLADKGNASIAIVGGFGAFRTYYRHDQHGSIVYPNYLNWSDAGPIIERERIELKIPEAKEFGQWMALITDASGDYIHRSGPTPLIAAMRCFVASKFGDELEILEELCK